MNKKLIIIGSIFIFLIILYSGYNSIIGIDDNSDENTNENDSTLNNKKIIIRDDDIGDPSYLPAVQWLSNLTVSKDFKVTFSIIPASLLRYSETIDYLKQLDQEIFEFAPHGYEHIKFKGLPYEEQYTLIENATKIFEEYLKYTPFTFVPPYGSSDTNTTKALSNLSYHSITDMRDSPCYVVDFISDFEYVTSYDPIVPCSFEEFKTSFDKFYNSSDEYFIILIHSWAFLDDYVELNETRCNTFEDIIDYMISKNVQFMKIEEAYMKQNEGS